MTESQAMYSADGGRERIALYSLAVVAVVAGLYLCGRYNYLLFHSAVEIFSVVVAAGIFVVGWHTRKSTGGSYLLLLGLAYLCVGVLEFLHTFSYKGMGVFPDATANLPTQLWIQARYVEAFSLLLAPRFVRRRIHVSIPVLSYAGATLCLIGVTFATDLFPVCYIEGEGLTAFKKVSEYIICVILLFAGILHYLNLRDADADCGLLIPMLGSITLSIIAELAFTRYFNVYGPSNFVGHILKAGSFVLLFKAAVAVGLIEPQQVLAESEVDLKETEGKYRSLVENANEAIIVLQGAHVQCCNQQALALTGYSDEEIGCLPFEEYVHPDDRKEVAEHYRRRLAGQENSARYSIRLITRSYEIKWVMVKSARIEWDCRPASLVMLTDITEVVENSSRLLKAQAVAHIGFVDWDLKTDRISVSHEAKKIFGLDMESGIQTPEFVKRVLHPDDLDMVRDSLEAGRRGAKSHNLDHRIVHPDGSIRWVHAEAELRYDAAGQPSSYIGTVVDITDRKIADLALRKAEEKYRTVADFTSDWEYWEAPDGLMVYVSPSCECVTGYLPEDFMDNPERLLDIMLEADRPAWLAHREAEQHGVCGSIQFRIMSKNDELRWIEHVCIRVTSADGKFLGYRGSNRDITRLKNAEQAEREQRDALARIDRTLNLQQLTGSIAHELNQPLTGILNNAQAGDLMIKGHKCECGEMGEIIADIIADSKRAGDVIRNLRELHREQAGEYEAVEINSLVSETLRIMHSEFINQHVHLDEKSTPAPCKVKGNRVQLQQVLLNLITNAMEATSDVQEERRYLCVITEVKANKLLVSVEDNGPGIAPDRRERIFEPLATWKPSGTGMGLAISDTIVRAQGGEMLA